MKKARWRALVEPPATGAWNMAVDIALLEGCLEGSSQPTLRLYRWNPPCLSLGRHQPLGAVDLRFCAAHDIDVVRRPTGGRAVLHHLEQTYSVIARQGLAPLPRPLAGCYEILCRALVEAMRGLGVEATLNGEEANIELPGPRSTLPCFKSAAGGEVIAGERKLIGSALRARRGAFIQHGSILLDWDGDLQAGSMGVANAELLRGEISTIEEQLGETPDQDTLSQALKKAFEQTLDIELEDGLLSPKERSRAEELAPAQLIATASRECA